MPIIRGRGQADNYKDVKFLNDSVRKGREVYALISWVVAQFCCLLVVWLYGYAVGIITDWCF